MRKSLLIIGNADLANDLSSKIDAADYVLRFNRPRGLNGWSGTKTDCIMMCNSGKPMQEMISDEQFANSVFLQQARTLTLVYHPTIIQDYFKKPLFTSRLFNGRKSDWTEQAVLAFGQKGKDVTVKSRQFYLQACAEISIKDEQLKQRFPSTGYLGLWDCLRCFDQAEWDIKLCGFTWQGWKRHDWDQEKKWVEMQIENGRLSFLS